MNKLSKLQQIIKGYGSCLIAFSGGTDSTFLLKVASMALPREKLLAVTAKSATYPRKELALALAAARSLGVKQKIIITDELQDKRFSLNPYNRCYFCKRELFRRLKAIAVKNKLKFVLDASNATDISDFRPGAKAKKELGVRSPLQEAGLTKDEIRALSRKLGLSTWNKPALACLASRVPYGTEITAELLRRIDQAELYLVKLGFKIVRLRHHNELCRIEVGKRDINRLLRKRQAIVDKLKSLGYNYITLDLEGYRTGSLNEVINSHNNLLARSVSKLIAR
jgi:uncharacterized protein